MKPVKPNSVITRHSDRMAPHVENSKYFDDTGVARKTQSPRIAVPGFSRPAKRRPLFADEKVSEIKRRIAAGNYHVDSEALAAKMLAGGIFDLKSTGRSQ